MSEVHVMALAGGALIGLSASLLLLLDGRVAGVSGILGSLLRSPARAGGWRVGFLAGLIAGGALLSRLGAAVFVPLPGRSWGALATAGLLVGFGTQLASGCTSGHGVCGLGRLSPRSAAAVAVFIATGAAATFLARLAAGAL